MHGGRPRRTVRVRVLATSRDRRGRCRGQATAPDRLPGGRTRTRPTMPCEGSRTRSESLDSGLGAAFVVNCTGIPASRVVSELSFLIAPTSCSLHPARRRERTVSKRRFARSPSGGSASPTTWSAGAKALLQVAASTGWPVEIPVLEADGQRKPFLRGARRGSGSHGNREVVVNGVWAEVGWFVRPLTSNRARRNVRNPGHSQRAVSLPDPTASIPPRAQGNIETGAGLRRHVHRKQAQRVAAGLKRRVRFRQPAAEVHPTSSEPPTGSRLPARRTERLPLVVRTVLSVV